MRKISILTLFMVVFYLSAFSQQTGWRVVDSAKFKSLRSVYMLNENEGWAVGREGTIIKWNGTEWVLQDSLTKETLKGVFFLDSNHGWAVGENGVVMKYNSSKWTFMNSGTTYGLDDVCFNSPTLGWTGDQRGFIFKCNGSTWNLEPSPVSTGINSFFFRNHNNGWAACGGGGNGAIIKYNGTNWTSVYTTSTDGWLQSIFFTDSLNGWAVGLNRILKYNGTTWITQFSNPLTPLYSVYFTDNKHGWSVGSRELIYHYNGNSWTKQAVPKSIDADYFSVSFTDSLHGWVVGADIYNSVIYYTETGGKIMPVVNPDKKSMDFGIVPSGQQKELSFKITGYNLTNDVTVTAPTGWQVKYGTGAYANSISVPKSADTINALVYIRFSPTASKAYTDTVRLSTTGGYSKKMVVKGTAVSGIILNPATLDFGSVKTNNTVEKSYQVEGHALTNDVTITAPTGFKVKTGTGSYASSLVITKTADSVNALVYVSFTPTQVKSYSDSIKHQSGTTVKYLKLTASGVVSIYDDPGQAQKLNIQCYPNPFDQGTTFRYSIPERSNVTLRIYSSNGQLVRELVNEIQQIGTHEITFNASMLTPGLYYYSISTETNTVRQKMVLVR
jgi:photosystem II stability/assembly factor-like uncharacterized protein